MKTLTIIVDDEGMGRQQNPYSDIHLICGSWKDFPDCSDLTKCDCQKYKDFEQSVQKLSVFDAKGNKVKSGKYEAELVDEVRFVMLDRWRKFEHGESHEKFNELGRHTRQIYRIIKPKKKHKLTNKVQYSDDIDLSDEETRLVNMLADKEPSCYADIAQLMIEYAKEQNQNKEIQVLDLSEFSINMSDVERAFCFGYITNPDNNCLDNVEMMKRWENFKLNYLEPRYGQ